MSCLKVLTLKAIPTIYRGRSFRSRAEARWAVFFDVFGIAWEYETEGFQLPTHWYLPDFWLPAWGCWAEVKAAYEQWDEEAITKASELSRASQRTVLLLDKLDEQNPLVWCFCPHSGIYFEGKGIVNLEWSLAKGTLWWEWVSSLDEGMKYLSVGCEFSAAIDSAKTFQFRRATAP